MTWVAGSTLEAQMFNSDLDNWCSGAPYYQTQNLKYIISGMVSLNDTPIQNAIVICIPDNNKTIIGTKITNTNGLYEFIVSNLISYHVLVSYNDLLNDKKYNATSKWGIIPSGTLLIPQISDILPGEIDSGEITILWTSSLYADKYRLEISRYSDFNILESFIELGSENNIYTFTNLLNSISYYIRIKAIAEPGYIDSSWSISNAIIIE